ncbi:MAG TPA: phosphatase PAP2 family protein [Firmicutes bacterium]|jgi:glycerophosphoryl diester phosphodiesterase|nr:phosphatase PAP2 family protein [Bacillota bacterium]
MVPESVNMWLQGFSTPWLDSIFLGITGLGDTLIYLLLMTFVYWCVDRRAGRALIIAFFASAWLNSIVKDLIGAARPSVDLVRVLVSEWTSGFPSGHAQSAAVAYTYLALRWPKRPLKIFGATMVLLISISRLYLGAHTLDQVIAGVILGCLVGYAAYWWERKYPVAPQPSGWRTFRLVLGTYLPAIPVQSDQGFSISGVLLGFLLTDAMRRQVPVEADASKVATTDETAEEQQLTWQQRMGRALIGWLGLGAAYALLEMVYLHGLANMFAHAALFIWVTTGAPAIFRFCRLGTWPQRTEKQTNAAERVPKGVPVPTLVTRTPSIMAHYAFGAFLLLTIGFALPSITNKELPSWVPIAVEVSTPQMPTLTAASVGETFLVLGHKGADGLAPGNTLAAFGAALQAGADIIECDVRLTADGHLVVFHDATVDAITDGTGAVRSYTLAELQKLDAAYNYTLDGVSYPFRGQDYHIPTLAAALAAYPETRFNIDMKDHDEHVPQALLEVLDEAGARDRVIVASFDGQTIRRFRKLAPDVATSLAQDEVTRLFIMARLGIGNMYKPPAKYIQVPERQGPLQIVTPSFVDLVHSLGMSIQVWTVNDRTSMYRLIDAGVDGIVTDYPDKLREVLRDYR